VASCGVFPCFFHHGDTPDLYTLFFHYTRLSLLFSSTRNLHSGPERAGKGDAAAVLESDICVLLTRDPHLPWSKSTRTTNGLGTGAATVSRGSLVLYLGSVRGRRLCRKLMYRCCRCVLAMVRLFPEPGLVSLAFPYTRHKHEYVPWIRNTLQNYARSQSRLASSMLGIRICLDAKDKIRYLQMVGTYKYVFLPQLSWHPRPPISWFCFLAAPASAVFVVLASNCPAWCLLCLLGRPPSRSDIFCLLSLFLRPEPVCQPAP
jgi:hypothetical protein